MVQVLNHTRLTLVVLILLSFNVIPFNSITESLALEPDYWPTTEWRISPPEDQGMNTQLIDEMDDYINTNSWPLHSFLVIRNGYIVYEYYSASYDQDTLHYLASATKSFVSTLIGIALDEGHLGSLSDFVVDIFDDRTIANMEARKQAMTVEHLLTMTAGLTWDDTSGFPQMAASPDWVQYVLDLPMAEDPGETWVYNSGASHLLSAIIQQLSGTTTIDFLETGLFQPLGISSYWWELDPDGIPNGGAGLLLIPRDMAKLGLLYLENGRWDNQLIIPAEYVVASSVISANLVLTPEGTPESGYGYQFWIYPLLDGYAAHGGGGQIILVVPERELVIVTTGNDFSSQVPLTDLLLDYVYPSIDGATTPSPVTQWLNGVLLVLVFGIPSVTLVVYSVKKRRKLDVQG